MTIRRSRPADGERVVAIWRDAVDATHHFLAPADRIAIEAEVSAVLPGLDLWLAVDDDDRAVGFMALDAGHVDALFVDPAAHGSGIGRALIDYALALQAGDAPLTTDVNAQNEGAVAFYRRLGFVPTGRSERDGQGRPYPLVHMRLEHAGA